jgi:hypothetical protein
MDRRVLGKREKPCVDKPCLARIAQHMLTSQPVMSI